MYSAVYCVKLYFKYIKPNNNYICRAVFKQGSKVLHKIHGKIKFRLIPSTQSWVNKVETFECTEEPIGSHSEQHSGDNREPLHSTGPQQSLSREVIEPQTPRLALWNVPGKINYSLLRPGVFLTPDTDSDKFPTNSKTHDVTQSGSDLHRSPPVHLYGDWSVFTEHSKHFTVQFWHPLTHTHGNMFSSLCVICQQTHKPNILWRRQLKSLIISYKQYKQNHSNSSEFIITGLIIFSAQDDSTYLWARSLEFVYC